MLFYVPRVSEQQYFAVWVSRRVRTTAGTRLRPKRSQKNSSKTSKQNSSLIFLPD